ncbi:MAG: hypothetical protein JOS17DRAFT_727524 [Linnemannia elongata]|nr:MAG: hypothetical protein JOS17DRAFT_727524 [Linnemannia elongata]
MKIGFFVLGLAASLASALPARNQTPPAPPARHSTGSRNNTITEKGCRSSTLRWTVEFPGLAWRKHNYFEFEVEGLYHDKLPLHVVSLDYEKWCSSDWVYCVTHANGQFAKDVTIMFNGLEYYHAEPSRINSNREYDWDYEYWDCVL